jgi:hypothetical protein
MPGIRTRWFWIFLTLLTLGLVSPAQIHTLKLIDSRLTNLHLPSGTVPVFPLEQADFDRNGIPETIGLLDGRATIQTGSKIRWQSPKTWDVRQAIIADLNHDNLPELVLLVWRRFKPWPVDAWLPSTGRIQDFHNSAGQSCHIILIGWYQNSFRERWAGSALAEPVKALASADLAGNGKQFLVTLETSYDDPIAAPARNLKVWEWNGFGFSIVTKLDGKFNQFVIARAKNEPMLIMIP